MARSSTAETNSSSKPPAVNPYRKRTTVEANDGVPPVNPYRKKSARKTKSTKTTSRQESSRHHPVAAAVASSPQQAAVVSPEVSTSQQSTPQVASVDRRLEFDQSNNNDVLESLAHMPRIQLESICRHALQASPDAKAVAERLWQESQARNRHCIRCHGDFDPRFNGAESCIVQDNNNYQHHSNTRTTAGSKDVSASNDSCWKGPHTIRFRESSRCWLDQKVLHQQDNTNTLCAFCQYGPYCHQCCTCRHTNR